MDNHAKGYFYASISAILIALSFIINSVVIRETSPVTAAFYMFAFAALASLVVIAISKKRIKKLKKYWRQMALIGFLNSVSAIMWFFSLGLLGPSALGFLTRFETVFAVIFGVIFLQEKFNKYEALGIAVIIIGALVLSYRGGILAIGAIAAIITSLSFVAFQFKSKIYVKYIDPMSLNSFRLLLTFPFIFVYSLFVGAIVPISVVNASLLLFVAIAIAIGAFLAMYKAYEVADLARVAAIRATEPLLIVLYSLIIFGAFPTEAQFLGGAIILIGTFLLVFSRKMPKLPLIGEAGD